MYRLLLVFIFPCDKGNVIISFSVTVECPEEVKQNKNLRVTFFLK